MKIALLALAILACAAMGSGVAASAACLPSSAGVPIARAGTSEQLAALRFEPTAIVVGKPFTVHIQLCPAAFKDVSSVAIDATMPAHKHGMNYRPKLEGKGDGRYEARGFLFHMPGRWAVELTIASPGDPVRMTLDLDVR